MQTDNRYFEYRERLTYLVDDVVVFSDFSTAFSSASPESSPPPPPPPNRLGGNMVEVSV